MIYLAFSIGVLLGVLVTLSAVAAAALSELGDDPLPEIDAGHIPRYQD